MRYSMIAAPLALAAGASAWNETAYTTEVVTAFTTYCPYATSFTHGESTYTVTEATTLTITNCPCTLTKPVISATPVVSVPVSAAPVVSSTPAAPISEVATTAPAVTAVPIYSTPVSAAPVGTAPASVAPPAIPPTFANSTTSVYSPPGTAAPVPSSTVGTVGTVTPAKPTIPFTGAANKVAASSVSLAALIGLAAYLL